MKFCFDIILQNEELFQRVGIIFNRSLYNLTYLSFYLFEDQLYNL